MVGKTKAATKAHKRRFMALQDMGCIACAFEGIPFEPAEIHHITSCGRRLGHEYSLPLCPHHHRGVNLSALPEQALYDLKGPSLARHKREFVARYGSELQLLRIVDQRLRSAA